MRRNSETRRVQRSYCTGNSREYLALRQTETQQGGCAKFYWGMYLVFYRVYSDYWGMYLVFYRVCGDYWGMYLVFYRGVQGFTGVFI